MGTKSPPTARPSRRQRIDSVVEDIRRRMQGTVENDPLQAFMKTVPPSKALTGYRDEILQLAAKGYTVTYILGYLKVVRNLEVCERTIRKFVTGEFKRAQAASPKIDLGFSAKAEFALTKHGTKSVRPAAPPPPCAVPPDSSSVTMDTGASGSDVSLLDEMIERSALLEEERARPKPTNLWAPRPEPDPLLKP